MLSHEIERRLRLPAPDEPRLLPSLVLPTSIGDYGKVRGRTGFRPSASQTGFLPRRLVLAVLALVVAMVAAIASGALRLDNPFDATDTFGARGVTVVYPDDWEVVAALSPFNDQGSWTTLIVSNTGVDGCSAEDVGSETFPAPVQSGDVYISDGDDQTGAIYAIEDRIYACVVAAPMSPGEIRLVLTRGYAQRIGVGPIEPFNPTAWFGPDATLGGVGYIPTAADGWDRQIDGMPAKLVVETTSIVPGAEEVRTWGIYPPEVLALDLWYVRATLRGPDLGTLRAHADAVAQSLRFDTHPQPLDPNQRAEALAKAIDAIDRESRAFPGTKIFGCFPRSPGEQVVTLEDGPNGPLIEPVTVTCRTTVEETPLFLWRATLVISWEAGHGVPAGEWGWETFFAAGSGNGGGQGQFESNMQVAFPGVEGGELPPLLTGPLEIPIGSIVRVLPPGIDQQSAATQAMYSDPDPRIGDRILSDAVPGRRFHVIDGPITHHGTDWYRVDVQLGTSYPSELSWLPATNDGRPLLEVVDPACPGAAGGAMAVFDLIYILPAERVACFGDREITIDPATATLAESFGGEDMQGAPEWLARDSLWRLYGAGGPDGVDGSLPFAIAPSVGDAIPTGTWLTVRGHFDDPAAASCTRTYPPEWNIEESPAIQHLRCSELFVVTGFEPRSAP
jgi:hypothetical protein